MRRSPADCHTAGHHEPEHQGERSIRTGPADVHLYAVDAGGGSLAPLAELPHCGRLRPQGLADIG